MLAGCATPVRAQLPDIYTNVKKYNATGDGKTDDSQAVNNAIAAVYAAGGGVVWFPPGRYLILSKILIPNDGASPVPHQPSMELKGAGSQWDGNFETSGPTQTGSAILDLRYSGPVAKIDTRGIGLLTLNGLALIDDGADSTNFLHTTNTTIQMHGNMSFWGSKFKGGAQCDQDAIVGGGSSAVVDGSADAAFQGYGTIIEGVYFNRIRRGVYGRTFFNSVVIANNVWGLQSGSDSSAAAIELDGSYGPAQQSDMGNVIYGNLFEATQYVYGITLRNAPLNHLYGNFMWDSAVIIGIRLAGGPGTSSGNSCLGCSLGSYPNEWVDDGGSNIFTYSNGIRFELGISGKVFQIGGVPGGEAYDMKTPGAVSIGGTATFGALSGSGFAVACLSPAGVLSRSADSLTCASGPYAPLSFRRPIRLPR